MINQTLTMNLVAADVRRLILFPTKEVRASLRRLQQFRGSMREKFRGILTHYRVTAKLYTATEERREIAS